MATGQVDVDILDVGQGQATFVEIYDDNDPAKLINTLLLDLGSENNSASAGKPSADYIVNTLNNMDKPTIDLLVLSHKDSDHVNLLPYLLSKFKPSKLDINDVIYSGRAEWYPAGLLTLLAKYTGSSLRVKPVPMQASSYNLSTKKFTPYYNIGGVAVYVLMANAPESSEITFKTVAKLPKTPQANAANTKSIVVMLAYENKQFIIGGDATYKTLCAINDRFKGKASFFPTVKMLTPPHHGSRKTTFGLSRTDATISAKKTATIDTFVELTKPESLTVSADRKFYHPSLETIEAFWKYVSDDDPWYIDPDLSEDRHSITAALDIELVFSNKTSTEYDYYSFQTTANVYSTLYSLGVDKTEFSYPPPDLIYIFSGRKRKKVTFPDLPEGVMWYYRITPTTFDLYRLVNRNAMTVLSSMTKENKPLTLKQAAAKTINPSPLLSAQGIRPLSAHRTGTSAMHLPASIPVNPGLKSEARSLSRMKAFR